MFTTELGGYHRKVRRVEVHNEASGATYAWLEPDDPDPGPATPTAPSWGEVPPAPLPVAFSAGKAAMAAGSGPSLRRDGRIPCFHCKACDDGRYQDCGHTFSKAEAQLHSQQAAADVIDQAETDAVVVQQTAFRWEAAHGQRV
jgi:hypothetical protein